MLNNKEELKNTCEVLESNEMNNILNSWNGHPADIAAEIAKLTGESLSIIKAGHFTSYNETTVSFIPPSWEEYLDWKKIEYDLEKNVVRYTFYMYRDIGKMSDQECHKIFARKEDLK